MTDIKDFQSDGTMHSLTEYSDPNQVLRLARRYVGKDVVIQPSTRAGKKYMIQKPDGKWVHFGAMGYEDFTKHRDLNRRRLFHTRNKRWATADKWSPAYLSFYLLW